MDEQPGDQDPSGSEAEGVRIIGPDEAAEAVERGDVVSRRSREEPRFGDRPSEPDSQPKGPRPTLRFPLADSAGDPEISRPPVRPVPETPRAEPTGDPGSRDEPRSLFSIRAASGGTDARDPEPQAPQADQRDSSGQIDIPHWTEPATGEVPAVIASDREDDEEAWRSFAEGTPRWRDQGSDFDERDDMSLLAADEVKVGALDEGAPGEEELLSFEDLATEAPRRRRPAAAPRRRHRPRLVGALNPPTGLLRSVWRPAHRWSPEGPEPRPLRPRTSRWAEVGVTSRRQWASGSAWGCWPWCC